MVGKVDFSKTRAGDYLVVKHPLKRGKKSNGPTIELARLGRSKKIVDDAVKGEIYWEGMIAPGYTLITFSPPIRENGLLIPSIDFKYYWSHNPRSIGDSPFDGFFIYEYDMLMVSRDPEEIAKVFSVDSRFSLYAGLVKRMIRPNQKKSRNVK